MAKKQLELTTETITPELATKWLISNTGNFRNLDSSRVSSYASAMQAGGWDLNGETIKFNGDQLIDGQHRLKAVVQSGVTILSAVARNVDTTAANIDRGKPRSVSQWLRHEGVKNYVKIATMARQVIAHDKGCWAAKSWGFDVMTDAEVISFAIKNQDAMNGSMDFSRNVGVPSTLLSTVLFIGSGHKNASKNAFAHWFCNGVTQGLDLKDTDPVLHFRNRMLSQSSTNKLSLFMVRMLLTIAWNKTANGEECSAAGMRIRLSGPASQKPPESIVVVDN